MPISVSSARLGLGGSQKSRAHTVGVENLGQENNLGRLVGKVLVERHGEAKGAPLPRRAFGPENHGCGGSEGRGLSTLPHSPFHVMMSLGSGAAEMPWVGSFESLRKSRSSLRRAGVDCRVVRCCKRAHA